MLNDIRLEIFEHLQRLSMDYYARTRIGDLVARFTTDLTSVETYVSRYHSARDAPRILSGERDGDT